jgi:pimeloyl-ACP methyl ester carboxylesterase
MTFPQANRLAAQHDVVMVGYRGVDGSSVLNCPEVTAALENSADFLGKASLSAYSQAFASCAQRLERSGVDLAGYTLEEQADDIEAARVALGYQRIDLLSESAGTRLGMIYSWMYPNSVDRSVMIGVNPPGNFVYSGAEIDQGIERYSALCAQQPACRARTGNLAASIQHTAAHMPSRWYFLPIKPGNVLVGTFLGLTESTSEASPLSGPMTLDSWISAAQGNPSGLWLLSEMAGLILPTSFVWGEFASIGMADAQPAERYFSSGTDRGSIIGNPLAEFLWGAGGLVHAWPANPGENQYTSVQNSNVPTLLIGGTLDFETPVVLGLGGFFGAALVVLTLWPALSLASELLRILAPSGLIALGLYLAWTHRDRDRATKSLGLLAAIAGALLGGWLGFTATSGLFALVTTTIGAAAGGNLALIAVSLFRERSARGHGNDPAGTYAVAPAPGSLAPHAGGA